MDKMSREALANNEVGIEQKFHSPDDVIGIKKKTVIELINTALALYTELDKIKKLKEKWMGIYQKAKKDYFEYGEVPDDEGGEMLLRKNNAEEIVNDLDKIGKEGNEQDN